MKVYGEVSINRDPDLTLKTPVDYVGGTCPGWNAKTPYILSKDSVKGNDKLVIRLLCERSLRDPKYIGEVKLSLEQLFEKRQAEPVREEFPVTRGNDKDDYFGTLKISYCFYEKVTKTSKANAGSDESSSGTSSSGNGWRILLPFVGIAVAAVADGVVPD